MVAPFIRPDKGPTMRVLTGAGRGRLARWLDGGDHLLGGLRPLVGPEAALVSDLEGVVPRPGGPSEAEATAARLRRDGAVLRREPGLEVRGRRHLVRWCRANGREAVRTWREDPGLLPEVRVGSWYVAGWRSRLARRVALTSRVPAVFLPGRLAADVAFWRGVHDAADARAWSRFTASSYVVLCYHRLSGQALPGQERMDVAPSDLRLQLLLLRLAGWRPLGAEQQVTFHRDPSATLPRRRYVVTADDGFTDAVQELLRHPGHRPQVYAVTQSVGGTASWLGDTPVAGWAALQQFIAAGGTVGSHARQHVRLDGLDDAAIRDQLTGSLDDLRDHDAVRTPLVAYPYGAHDRRVRDNARSAGYALAYTTRQGRNGAGTDPWCLRRVEPKVWDGVLSFAWKVMTGESPPARWERRLESRWRARASP
ncbi:MAG: polysaccharide deacetylase family protein [Marmoricola sp.]